MGVKDLHTKPFDTKTIAKLEIFEDYAQAWLPTFIMQSEREIHIFDFFAGPGYDSQGVQGSPIRLLEKVGEQLGNIFQKGTKIALHLNEFEPNKVKQVKFEKLKTNCQEFLDNHPRFNHFLTIHYHNKDAEELFFDLLPQIKRFPSLVYLDQNGIKFVSRQYIEQLEKLRGTDFLYFVSSSYFKWLGGTKEFKRVLEFDPEILKTTKQEEMHRLVTNKLKESLSPNSRLMLFPFSIKKGGNIYGIIFGATHYRAVDKFLEISWKKNAINGEADFDIDQDQAKAQLDLGFLGQKRLTKIEQFRRDLQTSILSGEIKSNRDALIFTYETGNYARNANSFIKSLKKEGLIDFEGRTAGVTYEYVFGQRTKRTVNYQPKK